MNATDLASGHVASVSEIQAALQAVRAGQFAAGPTISDAAALPKSPPAPADAAPSTPPPPPPRPALPAPPAVTASAGDSTGVWLLGTHGGSGARSLSVVLRGTRHAGRTWPSGNDGRQPVVLVCRSTHRGLTAAQDYARAYRDEGLAELVNLLGVIVSADAPGRLPPPLRRLERLLSGAAPVLGHAPWQPAWRLGPPVVDAEQPAWLTKLAQALDTATTAGAR